MNDEIETLKDKGIERGHKRYRCSGAPNYKCIKDNKGKYKSKKECEDACKPAREFKYRVANVDNIVNVYDVSGNIMFSNIDASTSIQYALNHLSSGRDIQEKVIVETDLTINSAVDISSFTFLELNGILRQGGLNHDLININNKHDITISGGELIGLGSKNGDKGWGIRTTGSNKQNFNIIIKNLKAYDFRSSGIALNQLNKNGLVQNCICNNNGLNGIGFGDDIDIIAKGNYCEGNRDSGLNIEDVWDFEFIDNTCVKNVRHNLQIEHGVNGSITNGIYADGDGDGINIRNRASPESGISKDIKVTGADSHNNVKNGLTIISSERIIIENNKFNNNGEYGVEEQSGDHNKIISNDLRNNGEKGYKIVGDHSIAKDNII